MKIRKIEFENFRNFKDKCCLTFPTDGGVTVIYGPNGVGKTTLHQLFQWIFYGEVHFNKTAGMEMYNRDFERDAPIFSTFSVWGVIDFEHPNCEGVVEDYSIRREWIYRKDAKGSKVVVNKIRISKDVGKAMGGNSNWETVADDEKGAAETIEQVLPSGLSQYFFFDGESMIADLNQLGRDSAKSLRKALYSIFDLDIYEQAKVHIGTQNSTSTVLGKLYAELAETSTGKEVEDERTEYNLAVRRVEKLSKAAEECQSYVERHIKETQELSEKIGNAPSRQLQESQRKTARGTIKAVEELIAREVEAFGKTVMEHYPYLFLSRVVEEAQFRIGLKVEDQQLPKGLTKELILTLLESDTCICGQPLTGKERFALEEWKKMFPPFSYKYIYDQFKGSAARWAATYDDELLSAHIKQIHEYWDQIEDLRKQIQNIDESLKKQGGNVDKLIADRARSEAMLRHWQRELSKTEQDLGVKTKLMEKHKKKLDELLAKASANKTLQNRIDIMEAVKEYFTTKLEESAIIYSADLCKAIQELLDRMLLGERKVTVSTEFELSVKDNHGNEAKSEGQFAIVSFAFIAGIHKLFGDSPTLKGKEFPLVLDGPFSKLDAQHRQNVIDTIPSYAPQVILFSKDDINECFGAEGPDQVWTIYSNDARNVSTVKHGYNPEVFRANGTED